MNCGYIPKDDPSYNFIRAERFVDNCTLILSECLKDKIKEDIKQEKNKMKIFDRKDVFSWANRDELRLATQGYVGNSLSDLTCNIAPDGIVQLLSIDENSALCFTVENKQDNLAKVYHFAFFLPVDKVKEVEEPKKYRPFKNSKELRESFYKDCSSCNGHSVEVEHKQTQTKFKLMIIGEYEYGIVLAHYGALSMNELFEKFNYKVNDNWQPFGVLEK